MSEFSATYLSEPNLVFGNQGEEKDPRLGLRYHGPYHYLDEKQATPSQVKVGIVGNGITLTLTKRIIDLLGKEIKSPETNKWLHPDFPGFSGDTTIRCDFITSRNWVATIIDSEIDKVLKTVDVNQRIAAGVNLFRDKVGTIASEDNGPDVIVCALPTQIEEYCGISDRTRGAKRPKFTELEKKLAEFRAQNQTFLTQWGMDIETKIQPKDRDLDFRNALKGKVMGFGIPVQVLRESSARGLLDYEKGVVKLTEEPAAFAWNFSTALYYKANGKPWRLAKLRLDTCYVGISFFQNLRNPNLDIQTSMAQVFTHNGEGIVLRGTDVTVDRFTREPHMTEKQAHLLLSEALSRYHKKAGRGPVRVVVHKKTLFREEERNGIQQATGSLAKDFVTIHTRAPFRVLRTGNYPVLRGSMVQLDDNRCLLYTTGYTPRVRTYPGNRVPVPLLLTHYGDSQLKEICEEILGLTKLNWNTTAFGTYLPITLAFAQKVGRVLSELQDDKLLQDHYRFYM